MFFLSCIYPVQPVWESGHISLFFFASICHQARLRGDIIGADEALADEDAIAARSAQALCILP